MPKASGKMLEIRFEPIIPKDRNWPVSKWERFEKELWTYLDKDLGYTLTKEFEKTTKNWNHAPKYEKKVYRRYSSQIALHVYPSGRYTTQWRRVSAGVRGHQIVPRQDNASGKLHFQESYTPHTRPGGKWGGPGRKYGTWRHPVLVNWPGIKPRHFAKEIAKKIEKRAGREIQAIASKVFR
jgi:hypothetical protein